MTAVLPQPKAAPDDRPELEDRADGQWLEPFDGDQAWERDQLTHISYGEREDW